MQFQILSISFSIVYIKQSDAADTPASSEKKKKKKKKKKNKGEQNGETPKQVKIMSLCEKLTQKYSFVYVTMHKV